MELSTVYIRQSGPTYSPLIALGAFLALSAAVCPIARAQGVYGVSSGLVLEAYLNPVVGNPKCAVGSCCGGMILEVSAGTYWLNGAPLALTPAQVAAQVSTWLVGGLNSNNLPCGTPSFLDVGVNLTPDTAFYCYETPNVVPICTTTIPNPNGQPHFPLGGGVGPDAVFIGSFLTDMTGNFIPVHRIGEQVVFRRTTTDPLTATTPAPVVATFEGGVAYCYWAWDGNNPPKLTNVCAPGGGANSFAPMYPATASAGLFDVHVVNANPNAQLVEFTDPTPYLNGRPSIQAEVGIAGDPGGSMEMQTVRLTLNANQLAPLYNQTYQVNGDPTALGQLETPVVGAATKGGDIVVMAVMRGYIEPVQRLYSR